MAVAGHLDGHVCDSTRPGRHDRGLVLDTSLLRVPGAMMLAGAFLVPHLPEGIVPACPLRAMTGIPCPLCGMTTSVIAAAHLRWDEALMANPAGLAAVMAAVILLVRWRPLTIRLPWFVAVVVFGSMWVFQLFRFQIL
jgi:hypothetical protein